MLNDDHVKLAPTHRFNYIFKNGRSKMKLMNSKVTNCYFPQDRSLMFVQRESRSRAGEELCLEKILISATREVCGLSSWNPIRRGQPLPRGRICCWKRSFSVLRKANGHHITRGAHSLLENRPTIDVPIMNHVKARIKAGIKTESLSGGRPLQMTL
jgi:hypothetical protein